MKKTPVYIRIAQALEKQIRNDVLKVGDKLPSLRTISREHGVSMNTATQTYLELERRGLILSRPQSGFYVSNILKKRLSIPATSAPAIHVQSLETEHLISKVYASLNDQSIVRLSLGVPDDKLLPIAKLNKALVEAMRSLPGGGSGYEEIQGNAKLRRDIARASFTWNSNLSAGDIITTAGTMNALAYSMMAVAKQGDTIAVESPVYFGILQLAKSLGLKVLELPTHPISGIDPDALKKVLPNIQLCLLVSNFNNPLGSCMPDEHKRAVVEMLTEHNVPLIEDDLYGDVYFGDSRPLPCKAFDTEGMVLWCGSVSKTLAPGYRVGWVAPGKFKEKILQLKFNHSVSSTTITQEAIANFLENGRYENHLRKLRTTLHNNSLQFINAIQEYFPSSVKVSRPLGGFVLWLELDQQIDTAVLYDTALHQGISIAPGRMFTLQNQFNHCMRLSYGVEWSPQVEMALKKLGKLVHS